MGFDTPVVTNRSILSALPTRACSGPGSKKGRESAVIMALYFVVYDP
jgi:hypothetical protein